MFLSRGAHLAWLSIVFSALLFAGANATGQTANKPSTEVSAARSATTLAEQGQCEAALPALEKSIKVADPELKRKVGLAGVHCSMTLRRSDSALRFLELLARNFPNDPDVLYAEIHAYSDLSTQASQMLATNAPASPQAHELLAESYEMQGKWDDAEKQYRGIVAQNPRMPGIHFLLGRLMLSKPDPGPTAAEDAKKEFQAELEIDPSNAGAEYVLGELARQGGQWPEAIEHFARASKLDAGFGDAFLGLGVSLISAKRFSEAIPPLETAVKLEPKNPGAHYNLAQAYNRAGRKQDADREFAVHRQMTEKAGAKTDSQATPAPPENSN
jgi:tetratricopeptide (TPR) repeat protein